MNDCLLSMFRRCRRCVSQLLIQLCRRSPPICAQLPGVIHRPNLPMSVVLVQEFASMHPSGESIEQPLVGAELSR